MLRLMLVRHGQTDANYYHFLQGQSNGSLNTTGLRQVEELGKHLKDYPIDQIFSSTLNRAQATAAAIAKHHHLEVKTTPLIMEWNCGILDGITADEFRKKLQEAKVPLSLFRPEGGETLLEVRNRAADFLSDLITNYKGQTVCVCSHGDFMRILLSLLQQVGPEATSEIYFDNASYTILELEDGKWNMVVFNQAPWKSHLPASEQVR